MSSNHDREQAGSAGDDTDVVRAWRQASDEQPPARLDAEILAAGRRSVEAEDLGMSSLPVRRQARSRWMQWQSLAAAATVAGLAFVLVQSLPREREVATPIRPEAPASAPALERETTAPIPGEAPSTGPSADVALESHTSAPAPEFAERAVATDSRQPVRGQSAEGATRSPAADVASEVAAEAATPPATGAARAAATPRAVDWIARIEALHASGDLAGAAEALREFRAADPDAESHLPEELRDWARSVD